MPRNLGHWAGLYELPPPGAKLQAGYIRHIRIASEEGSTGEMCFETRVCESRSCDENSESPLPAPRSYSAFFSVQCFYSAISYAWGDPTPRHPIIVDGHKRLVATNLWHFLQRTNTKRQGLQDIKALRNERLTSLEQSLSQWEQSQFGDHPSARDLKKEIRALQREAWPEGWLWIDALCIDQSDDRERTHQVGIMSKIFERAGQVISWLGPECDNSKLAMDTIASYAHKYAVKLPVVSPMELSEAICSLCERPYWKRLWVFQELRHAKLIVLMCGEHSLSWDNFGNLWRVVVDIATKSEDASERLRQSLATRMITLRTKPMDFSLWNLLKETRNLECVDRRDRVYALLSVTTEGHEGLEADYSAYMNSTRPDLLNETKTIPRKDHRERTQLLLRMDDIDIVAQWRAYLATSALAHQVLRARYAVRPPATLNDVRLDCEFLASVFGFEDQMYVFGDRLRPPQGPWAEWARTHNHHAVTRLLERLD